MDTKRIINYAKRIAPKPYKPPELNVALTISRERMKVNEYSSFEREGVMGHSKEHSQRVAKYSGAILFEESKKGSYHSDKILRFVDLIQYAAAAHDWERDKPNHAIESAKSLEKELKNRKEFTPTEKSLMVHAVKTHEISQLQEEPQDELHSLFSGSLYDADKFEWGIPNFTETAWLVAQEIGMSKEQILESFPRQIEFVKNISETFRTNTGKRYGPEFIRKGLKIANPLLSYVEMIDSKNILEDYRIIGEPSRIAGGLGSQANIDFIDVIDKNENKSKLIIKKYFQVNKDTIETLSKFNLIIKNGGRIPQVVGNGPKNSIVMSYLGRLDDPVGWDLGITPNRVKNTARYGNEMGIQVKAYHNSELSYDFDRHSKWGPVFLVGEEQTPVIADVDNLKISESFIDKLNELNAIVKMYLPEESITCFAKSYFKGNNEKDIMIDFLKKKLDPKDLEDRLLLESINSL